MIAVHFGYVSCDNIQYTLKHIKVMRIVLCMPVEYPLTQFLPELLCT